MDNYNLQNDIPVFGIYVKTFPNGIDEAFDSLVKQVGGFNRSFYGISYMDKGKMVYIATAAEEQAGEAEKYDHKRYIIEKGEYLSVTVKEWRKKTGQIKNVFEEIMKDDRADHTKPAIEWYKSDHEMMCMVRTKNNK